MITKLYELFIAKTTDSKISKISQLISMRYTSTSHNITSNIYKLGMIIDQLKTMETPLDNFLSIVILIASIYVPELRAVTPSFKTLADEKGYL